MHIVRLKISGFRGVRSADIALGRHAVLVGPNNSCKTTIIQALALLFGRDRLVRRLTEHDCHGSAPDELARILCIATVVGFTPNDPHHHSSWFSPERGVEKWFDGKLSNGLAPLPGVTRVGTLEAIHMPKVAGRPLRSSSCRFPYASPVSPSGTGKQKTTPKGRPKKLISLRKSGAGEGIRTLDPNLGKVVLYP
jgi:hypothetical protein